MEKYKPHISVCLMLIKNDKVLLMRRFNTSYQDGKYEFPSGHIGEGESLTGAVVREVKEEVGITIKEDELEFICFVDNHQNGKHVNFLFKTNKYLGKEQIMEPNECDDLVWKKINELTAETEYLSIDTKRFLDTINNKEVFKSYKREEMFTENKDIK